MRTNIYWLHRYENNSRLGIMARPRGGEWLDDEIAGLKKQEVGLLICLLEANEIFQLNLTEEKLLSIKHGIEYLHFPIADRSVPESNDKTNDLIDYVKLKLNNGTTAVIHCRMGIGRSSIIAGSVLLQAGKKANEVLAHISTVRGLKVPDTEEQKKWLEKRSTIAKENGATSPR